MEFSIIKILDGIFISNSSVLEDYDFLFNNKVSHIVYWTKEFPNLQLAVSEFRDMGIKLIVQEDSLNTLPISNHLQESTEAINQSRDQFLCTLLFADRIVDVIPLVLAYLQRRFLWSRITCLAFLQKKIALQNIEGLEQKIHELMDYQINGNTQFQATIQQNLKDISWNYEFLQKYKTEDPDEMLIINTMKNTMIKENVIDNNGSNKKIKKEKRLFWNDMIPRNSINAGKRLFLNAKINNSLKKNQMPSTVVSICPINVQKPVLKENFMSQTQKVINLAPQRAPSAKSSIKRISKEKQKDKQFQDFNYLSLKELSRTNFDDFKLRGSKIRKRQPLILKNQQQQQQPLMRSYGNLKKRSSTKQQKIPQISPSTVTNLLSNTWKGHDFLHNKQF